MKKITTLLLVFFLSVLILPQSFKWEWQNPKPHGNTLRTIKLISPKTLVAFGAAGTMQKSTDNGSTWTVTIADTAGREFRGADFVSNLVGYACGASGLMMKTVDAGATITYLNPNTTELLYDCDFLDADTGYVSGANGLLLKTTDGGTNWSTLTTPITTAIYAVCAANAANVFVGSATTGSVYRSTDYGASWNDVSPTTKTIWDITFVNDSTGWVASQNGGTVYHTTNSGTSWTNAVVNGLIVPNSVTFKDVNVGFVTNNNNSSVYKTTDGGATWTAVQTTADVQYAATFEGNNIYSVGRYGTMTMSTDNGDSYSLLSTASTITQLRTIQFTSSTVGYTAGGNTSSGFMMKTINGGTTWDNVGYDFLYQIYSFAVVTPTVWYAGSGNNKIFKTTDGGTTFNEQSQSVIVSTTTDYNDMGFADENHGFAVSSGGGIIKTTDGGATWVTANSPFGTSGVWAVKVFDTLKVIAVGASAKAFMTTDGGASWNTVVTGIPGSFFCMKFLNNNFGIIAGYNSPNPVASKTTDGGATWTPLTFPSAYDGNSIWAIGFNDENTFWLGDVNGNIYYTTDGGTGWNAAKKVTSNSLFSMAVVGNDMWISGTGGTIIKGFSNPFIPVEMSAFTSSVSGPTVTLNWSTATEKNNSGFSIERSSVGDNWQAIGFVKGHGTTTERNAYTFTDVPNRNGKIQYRLKQLDFDGSYEYSDVVEVNLSLPAEFSLRQNYPNPFNPTTQITYSLPVAAKVVLKIFNIQGREITTLVNKNQEAGNYTMVFDASRLSSGVYFYEINAGGFNAKKKMMLIK